MMWTASRSAFGISPSSNFSSFPTSMILKLPQLFKVAVAVEDSRKVLFGVVGGNSEVVRHSVFSFAVYAAICLMVLLA